MTSLKPVGGNKNKNIFKKFNIPNSSVMIFRCSMLFIFIMAYSANAQSDSSNRQSPMPSMLPDVSYPNLDKLIQAAKDNYPRIKTFEHRVASAKENVKKAKTGWFDIFTFSFLYSPNNSTTLVNPSILNGYQVGVFFNIGSILQKPILIKQAKEELNVSQYERDEYYVNLTALVTERYFIYIQQLAILKVRINSELDAESNMQMIKHKYEKGEGTLDDYNKSLVNLSDRTQSKIESEGALLVAKTSLEELTGKKLEEIN